MAVNIVHQLTCIIHGGFKAFRHRPHPEFPLDLRIVFHHRGIAEGQALCYFAGANSIFYGDKLLTTQNPDENEDMDLFARLGLVPEVSKQLVPEASKALAPDENDEGARV